MPNGNMTIDSSDISESPSDATHASRKLQYIDVLRGAAILGVVAVHCKQHIAHLPAWVVALFNFGQMGVQLFFIASAITLCLSMAQRKEDTAFNFYIRRFFRIAPLFYLGIVFYFCWRALLQYFDTGVVAVPAYYTLTGVLENLLFLNVYDPRHFNYVVPGGWSVATEMFFYLVFPFLYRLQSRCSTRSFLALGLVMVALAFMAEIVIIQVIEPRLVDRNMLKEVDVNDGFSFVYCTIFNQLSVFLIGILAFRQIGRRTLPSPAVLAALGLCTAGGYLLNTTAFKTGYNGFFFPLLSGLGFAIFALQLSESTSSESALVRALVNVGRVSFSMYLLHFAVLDVVWLAYGRVAYFGIDDPRARLVLIIVPVVAATFQLARLSHRYIESPGIQFGKRFLRA